MLSILSSRIDVRAIAILGMEAPGQLPGSLSVGLSRHSYVIGCVPVLMGVFHHCDRMCSCLDGCALLTSRSDVSAEIFHHCDRMCSCLDGSLPSL